MKEIVRGAIVQNNKVLILFRKDHKEYCFPGGKVDSCENKEEVLIREIKEEIGCATKIIESVGVEEFQVQDKKYRQSIFLIEIIDKNKPVILEQEIYDKVLWMNIKKYKEYKLAPHVYSFCKNYLEN